MPNDINEYMPMLTQDQIKRIKDSQATLPKIKKAMNTLKRLGLDTKVLDDKIKWAEEVQKTLLEDFK